MYAILVDVTKCTGCEKCVAACQEKNLHDGQGHQSKQPLSHDLSANQLLAIEQVDDGRFYRKACMHCVEPSCVSACLVGSLTKSKEGPVIYDASMCIGCRYCMLACPFHVPRYQWDSTFPLVTKCDMCIDRLQQGKKPACVDACPNDALVFGERDLILKKAHIRIKDNPEEYLQRVWGEHEFGGTGVVYVSDVDLSHMDWEELAGASIPSITTPLIEKTPFIGGGVAVSLLAINWVVQRRMRLAAEQSSPAATKNKDSLGEDN